MSEGRENKCAPKLEAAAESVASIHLPQSATLPTSPDVSEQLAAKALKAHRVPPTYFAPPERATRERLLMSIEQVAQSQVVTALLRSSTSMLCILNEHRQILTLNAAYLDGLKVDNADDVLGLRPGEAINCTHCRDHSAGCGTGPHCRTCGAAVAMVAAQRTSKPAQRECILTARGRKGELRDYSFLVRAAPCVEAEGSLLVLSLSDISTQKLHAGLQRAFLHDISNIVGALSTTSEMLLDSDPTEARPLMSDLHELTRRLSREILVQKLLLTDDATEAQKGSVTTRISDTITFLERLFSNHPSSCGKQLVVDLSLAVEEMTTDPSLLERVLINMLTNAFEASPNGEFVRLTVSSTRDRACFTVWNSTWMPETVASRVFQRFFSTKKGLGRGQGTYAMKLIGERLLHGQVDFTTSSDSGTAFTLSLPVQSKQPRNSGH